MLIEESIDALMISSSPLFIRNQNAIEELFLRYWIELFLSVYVKHIYFILSLFKHHEIALLPS